MAGPTIDDLLAQAAAKKAGQSGGDFSNAFTDADVLQVYLGANPVPDRGPAMHADVAPQAGPSDRGPAMHFDPERLPYPELRQPYIHDRV
jgi:hypothetical protein